LKYQDGRVAEWFKAPVLKTGRGFALSRGFESHPFRHPEKNGARFGLLSAVTCSGSRLPADAAGAKDPVAVNQTFGATPPR
jgi:hypothetical protein